MTYVVYSAPASEPVSVSEVKHFCRIDEVNQEPAPGALTVALGSGAGNVDKFRPEHKSQYAKLGVSVLLADAEFRPEHKSQYAKLRRSSGKTI